MKEINRVIWIVLDSVGVGELPDAGEYGDEGSDTIGNISKVYRELELPNLRKLGLGNIDGINGVKPVDKPMGIYCKSKELSNGKDTTTGHWEMTGIYRPVGFKTYPNGFDDEIIGEFIKENNLPGILANYPASGTKIIEELGEEHIKTKKPIIYTSADSVFQIACHTDVYSLDELYKMCESAREILNRRTETARVIARPFIGEPGAFTRTSDRRDYSVMPPMNNLLVYMKENGENVVGVGKIEDIFCKVGVTKAIHTKDNEDGMDVTLSSMKEYKDGLIFTNLVDFDSKWGHRNDPKGYGDGLEAFDIRLGQLLEELTDSDLLIINADHGCDPTTESTDHSREYVPVLVYNKLMKNGMNLHIRNSFADIGQTIAEIFDVNSLDVGQSFYGEVLKCID
ncbi:MAG: phosphopentomutase [Lachnospiraceae bacterium]|nr:phosphopentomutase [Lachnospiraceae bacterium]